MGSVMFFRWRSWGPFDVVGEFFVTFVVRFSMLPRQRILVERLLRRVDTDKTRRVMALDTAIIEKLAKVGLTVMRPDVHAPAASMPLFISRVAAGFPSPADDYVEKVLDLNEYCMPNRAASFFLRVSGHSMTGAGIHDGDILVVDRSITPKSGNVVIAVLDGELTVKRMVRKNGRVLLMPENPDYPTITIDPEQDFSVWGAVTFVVHKV